MEAGQEQEEVSLDDFREIWLVDFAYIREPGECPSPVRLTATEFRTGRSLRREQGEPSGTVPPYGLGDDNLVVAFDAPAQLGCHLALGWPLPARVLDLRAEFRCLTSGLEIPGGGDLAGALAHFRLEDGEDSVVRLLPAMLPQIDLPLALLRGRYTAAVARMEATGIPIDMQSLARLRDGWEGIQERLIEQVDRQYGVYDGRRFNPRRWQAWLNQRGIQWPRLATGALDLKLDTFVEMAAANPEEVGPMKELLAALSQMRLFRLAVGSDGRNRCPLRPFASKTGRNQPSTAEFIFGPATWLRGLIQPAEGMAVAYVDFEQQEFGLAAALSGDEAMMAAYRSGDPYLMFAKQAGAVPADATKATHREKRELFKTCALGVQYGMGEKSLATRLEVTKHEARELLQLHRETYPTYWRWSRAVGRHAAKHGELRAAFGWTLHVGPGANPRSVKNFPLQANGAEMLRLACCFLTEAGVRVCAPVHDALLIEAPAEGIDQAVEACRRKMEQASTLVLPDFPIRTEAKVVRFPDRYSDPRGEKMWNTVFGLLDGGRVAAA
jgi:hypothetical protein